MPKVWLASILLSLIPTFPAQAVSNHQAVCQPQAGNGRCHARVATGTSNQPLVTSVPDGYGPSQFHGAYKLPATSSQPQTIAIVDAFDDPHVKADLDHYDSTYGLPVFPTCTATNQAACFEKVDQNGSHSYPSTDAGWSLEIALDVETAHQICQNCRLLLVEASSASMTNLMAAVDQAVAMGAKVVSNSWGGPEFATELQYDRHFNHPGVIFTVSSGDNGYGVEYPAASAHVLAVGGTSLTVSTANKWSSETTWRGAGSGCSAYEPKPAYQTDSKCSRRTVADLSADADTNTGAAVYDSVAYQGQKGWFKVGGTSLASPLVASTIALAGGSSANHLYSHSSSLHDITTGSNGTCRTYLCRATTGYDGPTGLGTPNGLLAF